MRKLSLRRQSASQTIDAPIEVREAKVFRIPASRMSLCPEETERLYQFLNRVQEAAIERIISNPVKPASHYENLGRIWKELADYGSAVRKNDPHKAQQELVDLTVCLIVSCSLSGHLIKID